MACVVLLMVIALSLVLRPPTTHAANQYKYLVTYFGGSDQFEGQKEIDKQAKDGWEFAAPVYSQRIGAGGALLVFRKK